ncbi:Glycosyltransferase involved in cell wall bisynthesis [Prevotella sp. tc2-28]|uniref:glycosyltransferase family 2 protein n=1 Tax=Prevotella sp. tc2-28 TaxID=1761888 RepID=UPI000895F5C6|nr:glycosyltransferase family 2 protein [Prevotella sp. tc2-28]SEA82347.1 Glycosyltransferase involved in cell wall bisynthesis [Prevotella sp. tc2-28]
MKSAEFDITVIIPVYKVEKFIERCLCSVMNQTYGKPFECILVNDCTPDNSMSIVKRIIDGYRGNISFRVINHEKNRGLSAARNTGIMQSRGSYLLFVDSDDYIVEGCLEKLAFQLEQHPDITMVLGNTQNNLSNTIKVGEVPLCSYDNHVIRKLFYSHSLPVTAWNKLIRKDFILQNRFFFKEGLLFEDLNWSYRLFRILPSYAFVPEVTYSYEDNPQSIMRQADRDFETPAKSYMYIFEDAIEHIDKELYVDCSLFIAYFMLIVQDKMNKSRLSDGIRQQFTQLKRRLMKGALSKSHFLLALYLMILFNPWSRLTYFRFFRHHHHQIVRLVRKLSVWD